MTKLYFTSMIISILALTAHAQTFDSPTPQQDTTAPQEIHTLSVEKDTPVIEQSVEMDIPLATQNDFSEEIAARGIKTLPPEEVDKMRDNLRDNLRKTTKFDDLKEKINYLEVNNRLDKTFYRRKLQTMGENYETSNNIAKRKRKLQINPKDDTAIKNLILERAGISETAQQQ